MVEIQAAYDFPRYSRYTVPFLTHYDATRWKMQAAGSWFKLAEYLLR